MRVAHPALGCRQAEEHSKNKSQLSRNIGLHFFLLLVEGMRVSMATCVFCSSGLLTHFWGSRTEKKDCFLSLPSQVAPFLQPIALV